MDNPNEIRHSDNSLSVCHWTVTFINSGGMSRLPAYKFELIAIAGFSIAARSFYNAQTTIIAVWREATVAITQPLR
jgi:hypothetical protein